MNILTNKTEKSYKYKCEKLDCDSVEYKIVKDFYDKTTVSKKLSSRYLQIYPQPTDGFNVYKIIESNKTKMFKEKRNNLMLFHGTNSKGVEGILTEGFKNSTKGWFGKGVYMTDCSSIARSYCSWDIYMTDCSGTAAVHCGSFNENNYIFVNEVLESDSLMTIKHNRNEDMFDRDFKPENPFERHIFQESQKLNENDFKKDTLGRKYRNVAVSGEDEYLADESLVVLRYLIVIDSTTEC